MQITSKTIDSAINSNALPYAPLTKVGKKWVLTKI